MGNTVLDFIYIDAQHSYESCKADIQLWWPKLKNGGVFSVEDLVEKSFDELIAIDGIGDKTAQKILDIIAESVDFEEEDYDDEEEDQEDESQEIEDQEDQEDDDDDDEIKDDEGQKDEKQND